MTRRRSAATRVLCGLAAALPAVHLLAFAAPAIAGAPASPSLAMEEVAVFGSGDSPGRLLAPGPAPDRGEVPIHTEFLRARILAPISPWENDDEDRRAGRDRVAGHDRD